MINRIKEKVGKAGLIGGLALAGGLIATGAITFMARKDKNEIIDKIKNKQTENKESESGKEEDN